MTEEEIDDLEGRKCYVIGVIDDAPGKPDPIFNILGAWESDDDDRVLLVPPCVDGGTTFETVSIDQILLVEEKA